MKRATILAALLAGVSMSSATAADLGARPMAPAYAVPAWSWTGFYLGINGGYGWGTGSTSVGGLSDSFDINGGFVGGQLGYNWQTGNVVFGVEVDSAWADFGRTDTIAVPGGTLTGETNINYFGTARGRLGYAPGNTLFYATGGAAWANNDISFTAVVPPFALGISNSNTHVGWTVGAGIEWAFLPSWSAKVEYLYADFGKETYFSGVGGGFDFHPKVSTIKVGVNYLFR